MSRSTVARLHNQGAHPFHPPLPIRSSLTLFHRQETATTGFTSVEHAAADASAAALLTSSLLLWSRLFLEPRCLPPPPRRPPRNAEGIEQGLNNLADAGFNCRAAPCSAHCVASYRPVGRDRGTVGERKMMAVEGKRHDAPAFL